MTSEKFCYVYFGIAKDRSGFKVGVSQNPVKRASSFSTEIELEDSMQFRCKRSDALRMEKTIHFLFGKHRLKDRDITGEAHRVLWYLFGELNFDHYAHVPQAGIAENLDLTMPSVSRSIKLLCDKQIVLKEEKAGRKLSYRLNLEYAKVG